MSLFDAITDNDLEECERLIKSGVDVNQESQDYNTCTPLDLAIICDHKHIISLLQQNGGKLKYLIERYAYDPRYDTMIFILKKIKIDSNNQDIYKGGCPLTLARKNDANKIFDLFLKCGIDPLKKRDDELNAYTSKFGSKKTNAIQNAFSYNRNDDILTIMKFLDERNTKTRITILAAREFDAGSLLHRDYLPLDMFRLIFASMMKN